MSKVATFEQQQLILAAVKALAPANDVLPIVPNDGANLAQVVQSVTCGGNAGTLHVVTSAGNERTIAIAAGQTIPLAVRKVFLTGTSATGLSGLIIV